MLNFVKTFMDIYFKVLQEKHTSTYIRTYMYVYT